MWEQVKRRIFSFLSIKDKECLLHFLFEIIILLIFLTGCELRMRLPNGITGFYSSKANNPPQVDGKQFKQLCFHFVSHKGGKVIDFNVPQYPMNFYNVRVEIFNMQFYILLNEHYPYLAFATAVEFGNMKFVDIPVLFERFSPFYQVMDTASLNVPIGRILEEKNKHELNSAEWEEIAYWKPNTIGEIIFNYWD